MKKLVAIMMSLFLLFCSVAFVACGEQAQTVKISRVRVNDELHVIVEYSDGTTDDLGYVGVKTEAPTYRIYINEDKHAIVEYSDGRIEDLGYVGVEVEIEVVPPLYTVTFVDAAGNVIDVQEVYKGRSAKAPKAPEVQDKVFSGWDTDFTDVQGDLTVRPVYGDMATFTVTFKDEQGNVLSTQNVISGRSATAPTAPKREDTVFERWDKEFDKITEDTVVTAIYRAKKNFTVTFKDYNGLTLGTTNVKEGNNASATVTPQREGYTFTGWSGSLSNITSDTTVTAQYTLINGNNIFDISYKVAGNTVTLTLTLTGSVCLAGFEGELSFEGLTVTKAEAKSNYALINTNGNAVKITYSNATNVTKGETILTVTLTVAAADGKAELKIADCFDEKFESVTYKVIGQSLKLK